VREERNTTGAHGGKVRHRSATDGDSAAAWVEPSEGECTVCVCVCVCVGGGWGHLATMTTPSGQAGEVRASAWPLLGGLLEFSSGMPPKPRAAAPPSARGGDMGRGSWESGGGGAGAT